MEPVLEMHRPRQWRKVMNQQGLWHREGQGHSNILTRGCFIFCRVRLDEAEAQASILHDRVNKTQSSRNQ